MSNTSQVYTICAVLTPSLYDLCQAHLWPIHAVPSTLLIYANTPQVYSYCAPGLYKLYQAHLPDLFKSCRAHPSSIQAMSSKCQVDTSRIKHTHDLYKRNPGLFKPCPSTPADTKVYTNTPQVYTSCVEHTSEHRKHTTGLHKSCRAHPKSIQAVPSTPLIYTSHATDLG